MTRLIALRLPPGPRFLTALDAVWGEGDAVLPLDPDAPDERVHDLLLRLRPEVLIDEHGQVEVANPAPAPPGAAAVVLTSGTSGKPKAAVLSRRAVDAAVAAFIARLGASASDRWVSALPVHHVAGLMVVARARAAGAEVALRERFDPADLDEGATLTALVPTMLQRLLDAGTDLSGFRAILVGGARAPRPLIDRARALGFPVVRTYGMTETCGGVVHDGEPLPGVEVRIGPGDAIELRGPMLFDGYLTPDGLDSPIQADGWFSTRDVGRIIEDGRLEVLGRADDMIVTGGEKVAPGEVEAALLDHHAVADARVFGVDDDEWGEVVAAEIVPHGAPPLLEEIRAFVAERLGRHAAPRRLYSVERVERGALDKRRDARS